jgi:hypothetical protein
MIPTPPDRACWRRDHRSLPSGHPTRAQALSGLRVAACAGLAALAACADLPRPSNPDIEPPSSDEAVAREVARGIALALASPEVRASVRDAMRASPWDDHKLSLREFVGTPAGRALVAAAARARGVTPEVVESEIAGLPPLDFYMPVREHRRTWEGDANLTVVAAFEGEGDAPGYTPDGRVLSVSRRSADGLPSILFIQPAEWKGLRVRPQANVPGRVIEEPNDGQGSEVFIWHEGNGDSVVIDMALPDAAEKMAALRSKLRGTVSHAILEPGCDPTYEVCDCDPTAIYCEEPPPPPPPPPPAPWDTTLLGTFEHWMCDHTWCYEAGEFRWEAHYRSELIIVAPAYGEYRRGGVKNDTLYTFNVPLIYRRVVNGSADYMDMKLVEEDRGDWFGVNLDDDCGTRRITYVDNGKVQRFPNTWHCDGNWFGLGYSAEASYYWTPRY